MRMLEVAAYQSAQVQARQAWERRLLTPVPWPIPQGLRERALVRSVLRTCRQWLAARGPLQQPRGNVRRCMRTSDATQLSKPCTRRRGP